MNLAMRVATQNAINTSVMAANNAARSARNHADEDEGFVITGTPALILIVIGATLFSVLVVAMTMGVMLPCCG